jgi:hypothetical protein
MTLRRQVVYQPGNRCRYLGCHSEADTYTALRAAHCGEAEESQRRPRDSLALAHNAGVAASRLGMTEVVGL